MPQRDDFSEAVKRALAARVAYLCSNPECRAPTSGPHEEAAKAVNLGVAAHITAAAPGGPRYDASLTSEQRASAENAVWLCQNCAKLIDSDPLRFPVKLLREWKAQAEKAAQATLGKTAVAPPQPTAPTSYVQNLHGVIAGAVVSGPGSTGTGTVNIYTQNFYAGGPPAPSAPHAQPSAAPQPARSPSPKPSATPAEAPALASVYLSYGDDDLPFARRLFEALEAADVPVFFREEHDKPGVKQHRVVRQGIYEYDHVLLICSKRSLDDPTVLAELENMLGREHREGGAERTIPIWLDRYVVEGWKPPHSDVVHAVTDRTPLRLEGVEHDEAKFIKGIDRLIRALKG